MEETKLRRVPERQDDAQKPTERPSDYGLRRMPQRGRERRQGDAAKGAGLSIYASGPVVLGFSGPPLASLEDGHGEVLPEGTT